MPCYSIDGLVPVVDPSAFVHPTAVLIGDVWIGPKVYVGPCASLRGDFGRLVLEAGSNFQDHCMMHGFPGADTTVEADGHIGHGAVLHGCVVRRGALVGMNAVVMDEAEIGERAIVAACTFVRAGFKVPARSLIARSAISGGNSCASTSCRWAFVPSDASISSWSFRMTSFRSMRSTTSRPRPA